MSNVNVVKEGPDKNFPEWPAKRYGNGQRVAEAQPPLLALLSWQQLAVLGGFVALAVGVVWRWRVVWCEAAREACAQQADQLWGLLLPWATFVLTLAGIVYVCARIWIALGGHQADANQRRIVVDRFGNPVDVEVFTAPALPARTYAAVQALTLASDLERDIAPSKKYSGVNVLTEGSQSSVATTLDLPPKVELLPAPMDAEAGPILDQLRKRYSRSAEHLFVGSVGETPIYLRWGNAGVSALIGGSGGGKTNTARLIAAWHALNGGGLAFCDGHGEVRDESLIDSCQALNGSYILPPAISDDAIYAVVKRMDAIGRARIGGAEPIDVPLLLVFDEFISVCRNHPKAAEIVNMLVNFGDEYRKVNMQVLLTVHHGRGDVIDKQLGAVLRSTIGTRIVHNTELNEAKFWLKPTEAQGVDRLRPGEALFFDRRSDVQKIVVPWLPAEALREVRYPTHPGWPLPLETPAEQQRSPRQRSLDAVRKRMETAPRAERLRVADELASRGARQREIAYACMLSDEAAGAAWRVYHGGGNGVLP